MQERRRTTDVVSYPDFVDWSHARSFERLGALTGGSVTVAGTGNAEYVFGARVTPTLFETLGVQPSRLSAAASRPDEQKRARPRRRRPERRLVAGAMQGGAADAIGQVLRINDAPYTIVGVMPPDVRLSIGAAEQRYVPLTVDPSRNHGFLRVVGRLAPRRCRPDGSAG